MKRIQQIAFFLLAIIVLSSCTDKQENYEPNAYLSEKDQHDLLLQILPYFAKVPKGFDTPEMKFSMTLDTFYNHEVKKYAMQHYFISKDSVHHFMVNRPAPSLYEKKIAIAGKFKKDHDGKIIDYEEVFWTYKMKIPDLNNKGKILFDEMIKGRSLTSYMPGKNEEEWIEFPDAKITYNKNQQQWMAH